MKKRLSIIISIIVIVGIIVGVTLALFRKNLFTQNVSFNVDGITITYEAGDNITGVKLIPVTTLAKGLTDGTAIEKTITVSSTEKADFNLYLAVEILDNGLKKDYVKYQINKGNNIVGSGNFANINAGDTITLLSNEEIKSRNFVYKLYIWIDGSVPNSMDVFEQNYKFVLRATASSKNQVKTNSSLPDFILDSNAPLDSVNSTYVQNTTPGIDFAQNGSDTNGKGLYIRSGTENNLNPIYYYRGAVDNNNVYFANYCWKIVRTTDTGGLKMIYNGAPTNGTCGSGVESQSNSNIGNSAFNNNYDDAKYVGYTYDNNGTETDSTIKGVIDTWYQTNILANYDSYIEDTIYCNDREEASASELAEIQQNNPNITKAYKPYVRLQLTGIPSLECTNNADKYTKSSSIGNGKLQYPVGLLTADEIWLAGKINSSTNNYLNNNSSWWSLSPGGLAGGEAGVWCALPGGGLDVDYVDSSELGARLVITLKPEYNSLSNGDGSVNDPYRFVETFPEKNDNNGGG